MDLRLYYYSGDGQLRKVGKSKSRINKLQRHFFDSLNDIHEHISWLHSHNRYVSSQLVIIEYTGNWQSKIIEII